MGWLEVLALLKRLGPTLSRILPMLEMFVASRGTSSANSDASDRLTAELKDQLAALSASHSALTNEVSALTKQVQTLRDDLRHSREADERVAARLLEVDTQITTLGRAVQQTRSLLLTVVILCFAILLALVVVLVRR